MLRSSTPATAKAAIAGDPEFAQDDTLGEQFFSKPLSGFAILFLVGKLPHAVLWAGGSDGQCLLPSHAEVAETVTFHLRPRIEIPAVNQNRMI